MLRAGSENGCTCMQRIIHVFIGSCSFVVDTLFGTFIAVMASQTG